MAENMAVAHARQEAVSLHIIFLENAYLPME